MVLRFSQSKISVMKTMTFEGIVENGQIKLPETVHLPDHTKVLVVVPDMKVEPFTIATGDDGLPVIRTTNGTITSQLVKDIETLSALTFLLDVNVLMALLWENHEHHQVARAWLRAPRISQRVQYRSSVSHGFLPIHLSATACRPIRGSAF